MKITGWLPSLILFKPKYYYEDKKIQKRKIQGGAIIASNHRTTLDPFLLMFVFMNRYLHCLVGEFIYENIAFVGTILDLFGSIRVERFTANPDYLNTCNNILVNGGVVQIYPEGHLPRPNQTELSPFKSSTVLISIQSRKPIIPIYHQGNYGLFKRETIAIGTPLHLYKECQQINPTIKELERLTKILQDKINQLKLMVQHAK
jgi:1-acyl-sn-glycerol-3-phosphate acyltransferase